MNAKELIQTLQAALEEIRDDRVYCDEEFCINGSVDNEDCNVSECVYCIACGAIEAITIEEKG